MEWILIILLTTGTVQVPMETELLCMTAESTMYHENDVSYDIMSCIQVEREQ